jgi:hypothetical protein
VSAPRKAPATPGAGLPWLAPTVLVLATLAIRLIPFNVTLMGWDEWILSGISIRLARVYLPAHEWYDVLVPTGYSYPPVFFWLNSGLIYLLGAEPLVLRIVSIVSEAACVAAVTVLAQRLAGRFAGWSSGLLAFSTLYLSFHETVTMDFLLSFWILLSLVALMKTVQTNSPSALFWALFISSAAVFTKYHGVVYHAILYAMVLALPQTRAMLRGRGRVVLYLIATLALPCSLLALEALTWHFYGYTKTHIAEVFRVMDWTSYVQDPFTGDIVQAQWHFYFLYLWKMLGPVVCVLGVFAFLFAFVSKRAELIVIAVVAALWFTWASSAGLKNARYILPGALMLYPLVGVMLQWIAARARVGRPAAVVVLAVAVGMGVWGTRTRVICYLREAAVHQAVYDYLRDHVASDAVILAESAPFQWGMSLRSGAVRPVHSPEDPNAFVDSDYFIAHEWGRLLIESSVIQSAKGYLDARDDAVGTWTPVLDLGNGRERVQVFRNPAG